MKHSMQNTPIIKRKIPVEKRIKFQRQLIMPAAMLSQDEAVFHLCNDKMKSLKKIEERSLISILSAFKDFELVIDTTNWDFIVNECTKEPTKLRSISFGGPKRIRNEYKSHDWSTEEILNFLHYLHDGNFSHKHYAGKSINKDFRYIRFVYHENKIYFCNEKYESYPLEMIFEMLKIDPIKKGA